MKRTVQGVLLMATIGALAALAFLHGGFAAWFLAAVSAAVAGFAWCISKLSQAGLSVEREFAEYDGNGNPARIRLTLRRSHSIPLAWLVVQEEWIREGQEAAYRYAKLIFPGLSRTFEASFDISHWPRGKYRLSRSAVAGGDFFGLFGAGREMPFVSHREMRIYPAPVPLPSAADAAGRSGSALSDSRRAERGGAVVKSVRGYSPGDPLNRIDWKRFSRQLTLMTKEMEGEGAARSLVVVDQSPRQREGSFEFAVALTAGMVHAAKRQESMLGLFAPESGSGAPGFLRGELALDWLAEVWMSKRPSLPETLEMAAGAVRNGSAIFLVTSLLTDLAIHKAREISAGGIGFVMVYIMEGPVLSWNERQMKRKLELAGGRLVEIGRKPPGKGGEGDASA